MASEHHFTISLHPEPEGGFTVLVPALPEVVTYGETFDEAMTMAREAIGLTLEIYREDGRDIPENVEPRLVHVTIAA